MKVTVQVVIDREDGTAPDVHEVGVLERQDLTPASAGLRVAEAHQVLAGVQQHLFAGQVDTALAAQARCPGCGRAHRHKDSRTIVLRSLFGTLHLPSPRWWRCPCTGKAGTFSPLTALLPERVTPELMRWEATYAAHTSYEAAAELLGQAFPLGRHLHAAAVRRHVEQVGERLDGELGDERFAFIDTCPADWAELPRPDLPLVVGIDGGYVHSARQTSRRDGWFEVIVGRSTPTGGGPAKCFAFVQTHDRKPKRRVYETLRAQGMADNQQVTFLSDGGEDIRDLPLYLNPQAEHLLDWFHITMRLTVLRQTAKGLPDLGDKEDGPAWMTAAQVDSELTRIKWLLWHGNTFRALQLVDGLLADLDCHTDPGPERQLLAKRLAEFRGYIDANTTRIPNYGERRRCGEAISSATAESAVNQIISKRMVKKQQMRWTPRGAHLLLQVRTRVLNNDLDADFTRWYPSGSPDHETTEPIMRAA